MKNAENKPDCDTGGPSCTLLAVKPTSTEPDADGRSMEEGSSGTADRYLLDRTAHARLLVSSSLPFCTSNRLGSVDGPAVAHRAGAIAEENWSGESNKPASWCCPFTAMFDVCAPCASGRALAAALDGRPSEGDDDPIVQNGSVLRTPTFAGVRNCGEDGDSTNDESGRLNGADAGGSRGDTGTRAPPRVLCAAVSWFASSAPSVALAVSGTAGRIGL